jgi:hypothetical protein
MKYLYFFLFVLAISSCNRTKYVEFDGTMPGIKDGAFVIKDDQGNQILSAIISDGKFHVKNILQKPGFYDLYITPDIDKDGKKKLYEVYLEGGNYTITADADKLYLYPTIKSDSKIQNELSDYYASSMAQTHTVVNQVDSITDMLYDKNTPVVVDSKEYFDLQKQLKAAVANANSIQAKTLGDYVSKNPQNEVEAYLLSQIDYKKDPATYNGIYNKFTTDQKNTDEGKEEGDELAQLMKLAPGAKAPTLAGKTLDGKAFDPKSVGDKKVILIEFWRADNELSHLNHVKLLNAYSDLLANKDFTVISVSLDTTKDVWVQSIQKDKLPWIQVSDLQGGKSPNMVDWSIDAIPTYDLVDGNWHFIKRNIDFGDFAEEVDKDLKK